MNAGSGEADDADAIDQESVLPYYHQLKRILRTRIARDGLNEGDRLWSDREVGDRYGVSRSVVRQAMAELESEGVLHRVKGKGTFLAPAKIDHGLALSLQGLFAHARSQGHTLKSEILRQEIAPMDEHAAAILEVPAGSPGFVLERIRRVDGEPWAHTITWIPAGRVPGIEKEDFTSSSLYQCLTDVHGIAFGQASRSIEAVPQRRAHPQDRRAHVAVERRGTRTGCPSKPSSPITGAIAAVSTSFWARSRTSPPCICGPERAGSGCHACHC